MGSPFQASSQGFSNAFAGLASTCSPFNRCGISNPCPEPKSTTSRYYLFWVFLFELPLKVFKMHLLGRKFQHLYKECFVLLRNSLSTLIWDSMFSLALVPLSKRRGISQSTPSGPSVLRSPPHKTRMLGRRFQHAYQKCFVLLHNRCGISLSSLIWDSTFSLTLVPLFNRRWISQSSPFNCGVVCLYLILIFYFCFPFILFTFVFVFLVV